MKLYEYVKVADWIEPNDYIRASLYMIISNNPDLDRRWLGEYLITQNAKEYNDFEIFSLASSGEITINLTREQFIDLLAKNIIVPHHNDWR